MSHLKSGVVPFEFHVKSQDILDKRYPSGRLVPVFPSLLQGSQREEEYIARMIARDRATTNH